MQRKVKIRVREVYGNRRYYPANDNAQTFAQIAGTVTLSKQNLELIAQLGYQVHYIADTGVPAHQNRVTEAY